MIANINYKMNYFIPGLTKIVMEYDKYYQCQNDHDSKHVENSTVFTLFSTEVIQIQIIIMLKLFIIIKPVNYGYKYSVIEYLMCVKNFLILLKKDVSI